MHLWATIIGAGIILSILLDAFETIVLPRRVQRGFRLTAFFYRNTWRPWARAAQYIRKASRRENFLGYFGPLSLIVLLGFWAAGLIVGFAFVQYGLGDHLQTSGENITHWTLLYHSGETFFTLGYGDITPNNTAARVLAVMEAGMGFAFLGVVIGYLPVVYSAFTTREIEISLLDARAGSPPSAAEFWAGWVVVRNKRCSTISFATGSAGVRTFCPRTFLIQCWYFFGRSMQPVLAGRANCDAGCDVVGDDWRGRYPSRSGETNVRYGASRGRRPDPDGQRALSAA